MSEEESTPLIDRYEITFIVDEETSSEKVEKNLSSHGAKLEKTSDVGKKQFTHPLGKKTSGHYFAIEFVAEREKLPRIELDLKADKTLIRYLMRHNHTSPFEMIEFKFKMKMPIFTARQFIRTRTANVNELSGRYSEMPEEYYVPDVTNIRMQSTINTQGSEGIMSEEVSDAVVEAIRDISSGDFDLYHDLLENGVVREQSRMVLPLSTYTEWYWKIDLKNLLHFLNLRCDSHAQQEIRVYGEAILNLIKPIVPWTIAAWEDYSPYRGGMMLSKYEVAKIQSMLKYVNMNNGEKFCPGRDIDDIGKLENREWVEKADKLGF